VLISACDVVLGMNIIVIRGVLNIVARGTVLDSRPIDVAARARSTSGVVFSKILVDLPLR
jgi:hypothetical protein